MNETPYRRALWLTAAALTAAAVPADAEVYLTESQALGVVLGEKAIVRREQKQLEAELRRKLEQSSNLRFSESVLTFFIATQDGKPSKYAVVMNETGKTEPITFMVGMNPEGKVTEVVIMEFRENRGWEVKEKRFLNQFRGKTARSSIRVDEDIINYTGATLSSKAVARGVKKALILLDAFYPGESRTKLAASRDFAQPTALRPISQITRKSGDLGLFRQVRYAMGTHCEIRVWCDSPEKVVPLFREGFLELERIEQIFSGYRENSELSQVNRSAAISPMQVSEEFFNLTQEAMRTSAEMGGVVDITISPLMQIWGIRQGSARIPTQAEIAAAKALVGSQKLTLDSPTRSIHFAQHGMELDFGGIAKGYAAEKIASHLERLGAISALVNLGRSSLCASRVPEAFAEPPGCTEPSDQLNFWPIAILHPDGRTSPPLNLILQARQSLSTSGTGERSFTKDGINFSHILNATTGMPILGEHSASVVAQTGVECEVASKELLLLDSAERGSWAQKRSIFAWARFDLDSNGELHEGTSRFT